MLILARRGCIQKKIFLFIFAFASLSAEFGHAYFELSSGKKPIKEMNGITFEKYKNFPDKWHLVTVRYRMDSKEMRFVYANDIAWEAMKSFKPNYPDGAIFGKVGMMGEPDPAFPSSVTPAGSRRFQFMVKNKLKYKDTDGWGYALFDAKGELFDSDIKKATNACAACHRIVPERDYVFSRKFQWKDSISSANTESQEAKSNLIQFKSVSNTTLPKSIRDHLEPQMADVDELIGPLKDHAFSGTLDEIVPQLILQVKKNSRPAMLRIDEKNFSLVMPQASPVTECSSPTGVVSVLVVFNSRAVRNAEVCQ